jgi:hypothetical protein
MQLYRSVMETAKCQLKNVRFPCWTLCICRAMIKADVWSIRMLGFEAVLWTVMSHIFDTVLLSTSYHLHHFPLTFTASSFCSSLSSLQPHILAYVHKMRCMRKGVDCEHLVMEAIRRMSSRRNRNWWRRLCLMLLDIISVSKNTDCSHRRMRRKFWVEGGREITWNIRHRKLVI